MIGLPRTVDWAEFTRVNRVLDTQIRYADIQEDWQKEIDKGIAEHARAYLQLPRGHDKTDRYSWWSMLWLQTTTASRGYAVGVDRDNAKLFRDSAKKHKALHPELFAEIEIEKHVVFSKETGSYIETISSDVQSAYGLNFDLLIVNDFHAWENYEFWEVLWTACRKKPDIRVWMESNALTLGTPGAEWVAKFRKWVRDEGTKRADTQGRPEWFYYNPTKFLAGWQKHALDEWRATLIPSTYKRLIENQDCSGDESFLTEDQVDQITVLKGPISERASAKGATVTVLDFGLVKDATCISTLQMLPRERREVNGVMVKDPPRIQLLAMDVLAGSKQEPVNLEQAEKIAFEHRKKYKSTIHADPWQAKSFIQRYPGIVHEWPITGGSVAQMTQILYRCVADKNLTIYPCAGEAMMADGDVWDLKRELISAVTKEMSYGTRVDHRSGGYSDRLFTVGMACHVLLNGAIPRQAAKPEEAKPPTQDEVINAWVGKEIDKWVDQAENGGERRKPAGIRM